MDDWSGRGDFVESPAFAGDDEPCLLRIDPHGPGPGLASIDPDCDIALMDAVGRGDVRAYARLVERHLSTVYRLCYRLTGDRHDAEDLTQESFARLWQSAPGWRSLGGGLPAWLQRVARNLCFDRLRGPRDIPTPDLPEIVDQAPSALRQIQAWQLRDRLEACLHRLSPSHRSALVLSYYEGHSNALAAQIMDMNLKAFESLVLRARKRMSQELSLAGVRGDDIEVLA